jgi:hypothetical protein
MNIIQLIKKLSASILHTFTTFRTTDELLTYMYYHKLNNSKEKWAMNI